MTVLTRKNAVSRETERYRKEYFSSNSPSIELGAPPINIWSRTLISEAIDVIEQE